MNPLLQRRHGRGMVGASFYDVALPPVYPGFAANGPTGTNTAATGAIHLTAPTPATFQTGVVQLNPNANPSNPIASSVPAAATGTIPGQLTNPEKIGLGVAVLAAVLYFSGALK